jgi:hypothetical protein
VNNERSDKVDEMLARMEGLDWESLVKMVESDEFKALPPPEFPHYWYNSNGEQVEVYHTNNSYYGRWIDHNLTLHMEEGSSGDSQDDKVIGYVISDVFGLLRKCFGKELTIKIKQIIEDHERTERERKERRIGLSEGG